MSKIIIFYLTPTFDEIALSLHHELKYLGYEVEIMKQWDTSHDNSLYILMDLNNHFDSLPKNYIAYQFEQLAGSNWLTNAYLDRLRGALRVWDYSMNNIQLLQNKYKFNNLDYVPLAYCPLLNSDNAVPVTERPIDILFYGTLNERRTEILNYLKTRRPDWQITIHTYIWQEQRNCLIDQAKLVLNLHYYPQPILETSRLSLIINRGACFVSEKSQDKCLDHAYRTYGFFVDSDQKVKESLYQLCEQLLADPQQIETKRLTAFNEFKKRPYHKHLPVNKIDQILDQIMTNEAFIKAELEEAGARLKLDSGANVPVSIITPTRNRVNLFKIAERNFQLFDYPRSMLEWIVVDDSDDTEQATKLEQRLSRYIEKVKYIKLNQFTEIWHKRNIAVEHASHEIIVHMDDDDYYFPESLYAKVKLLQKYPEAGCVGSSEFGAYHLLENYSYLIKSLMMPEAGLAYRKSFWQERPFMDQGLKFGEGYAFLKDRNHQVVDFPYWFNFIAITHGQNATGNLRTMTNRPKSQQNLFTLWNLETQLFMIKISRLLKNELS